MRLPAKYRPLAPYLAGKPDSTGEWDIHCPLHEDEKRSASINFQKGLFNCFAGCGGGSVDWLLNRRSEWITPPEQPAEPATDTAGGNMEDLPSARQIRRWHRALLKDEAALDQLLSARGLYTDTIKQFQIGYDESRRGGVYTIPVFNDNGEVLTVRFYKLNSDSRTKIWHVKGHGGPFLYPANVNQDTDFVILCEGEWDAIITNQAGFPALTKTGSAATWRAKWNHRFAGKRVYLCHDRDKMGQQANIKVGREVSKTADEVRVVHLPYPITDDHGKDLSDFWNERGGTGKKKAIAEFKRMLDEAQLFDPQILKPTEIDPSDANPADAINAELHGKPIRLTLTVKGRGRAGYVIPHRVKMECDRSFGAACNHCPMADDMKGELEIERKNPDILKMINSKTEDVDKIIKKSYGIPPRCDKVELDKTHQSVEILYARPSVEHSNGLNGTRLNAVDTVLRLTSVGRHDTPSNCSVQVVGSVQNNPRSQETEFLAWDVSQLQLLDDHFKVDEETHEELKIFRNHTGETPLQKLEDISDDLARNVTHIYGRPLLHIAIDLSWHSIIQFEFMGELMERGWLEVLAVGDTRTGKSHVASRMAKHYQSGEVIDCERSSLPGIVGSVQQIRNEWMVQWGAIPINDKRLVVMDEVSGLSQEEIGAMSGVRASGVAAIEKVVADKTFARTRKIWLSNPRDDLSMDNYAFGIFAIKPLIGRNEDIARFDLAMSLSADDVDVERYVNLDEPGSPKYPSDTCAKLVRWAWTRTAKDVVWAPGTPDEVLKQASRLGKIYTREPPLILRQDVRVKVARLAVAIASRLYSSRDGREVYVRKSHVRAASRLLDIIYSDDRFGYRYLSLRAKRESKHAMSNTKRAEALIRRFSGLDSFMLTRPEGRFFARDLEEVLGLGRDSVNSIINGLMQLSMVTKDRGYVRISPELQQLLRRMQS